VEFIHAEFMEEEANTILGIPLNPLVLPKDKLIWRGTGTGEFLVRSAYHLGMELQEVQEGQYSNTRGESDFCKVLWALGVPNVAKIFI
jgi:hypothetical protein